MSLSGGAEVTQFTLAGGGNKEAESHRESVMAASEPNGPQVTIRRIAEVEESL
jgi:hypothetical protein